MKKHLTFEQESALLCSVDRDIEMKPETETAMNTYEITGQDAIRLSKRDNLTIRVHTTPSYPNPVVSWQEAVQIAKDDPELVFVRVTHAGWWGGSRLSELNGYNVVHHFDQDGTYLGPDADGIEPTWNDAE